MDDLKLYNFDGFKFHAAKPARESCCVDSDAATMIARNLCHWLERYGIAWASSQTAQAMEDWVQLSLKVGSHFLLGASEAFPSAFRFAGLEAPGKEVISRWPAALASCTKADSDLATCLFSPSKS